LQVRRLVNLAMAPARPPLEFRQRLRQQLLADASRRRAGNVMLSRALAPVSQRAALLLGLAGLLALAVLLAFLLRRRP